MTTNFKTAVKLQSGNIRSPRCRMSYPRLFTPQPDDKGTLFYTCSFLIYPDCDISLLKNEGAASVKEKFGDKVTGVKRSEEHTSELQSLMRISYAVFCLTKTRKSDAHTNYRQKQHKRTN